MDIKTILIKAVFGIFVLGGAFLLGYTIGNQSVKKERPLVKRYIPVTNYVEVKQTNIKVLYLVDTNTITRSNEVIVAVNDSNEILFILTNTNTVSITNVVTVPDIYTVLADYYAYSDLPFEMWQVSNTVFGKIHKRTASIVLKQWEALSDNRAAFGVIGYFPAALSVYFAPWGEGLTIGAYLTAPTNIGVGFGAGIGAGWTFRF